MATKDGNTEHVSDEQKQEVLSLIQLLSWQAQAEIAALMSAMLDERAGLLLKRDATSLKRAISKLHATGNTAPLSRWLRKHLYFPLTDSRYSSIHRVELIEQDKTQ